MMIHACMLGCLLYNICNNIFVCLFVFLFVFLFFCREVVKFCDCVPWEDHIAKARERMESEGQKIAEELKESIRIAKVGIKRFQK